MDTIKLTDLSPTYTRGSKLASADRSREHAESDPLTHGDGTKDYT
jgi:hypothetical protein